MSDNYRVRDTYYLCSERQRMIKTLVQEDVWMTEEDYVKGVDNVEVMDEIEDRVQQAYFCVSDYEEITLSEVSEILEKTRDILQGLLSDLGGGK